MVWQWKNTRMVYFCLSLTPVFQKKKNQVFHSPRNEICQPRKEGNRKMLPHKKLSKNSWRRSQKIIKNDKEEKRIYKVLLREAKSSNLNLTPHTTVFHQFPYYSHLWTMSRVPGNRTGIEIRSFKDQLIVNLMSFSI